MPDTVGRLRPQGSGFTSMDALQLTPGTAPPHVNLRALAITAAGFGDPHDVGVDSQRLWYHVRDRVVVDRTAEVGASASRERPLKVTSMGASTFRVSVDPRFAEIARIKVLEQEATTDTAEERRLVVGGIVDHLSGPFHCDVKGYEGREAEGL